MGRGLQRREASGVCPRLPPELLSARVGVAGRKAVGEFRLESDGCGSGAQVEFGGQQLLTAEPSSPSHPAPRLAHRSTPQRRAGLPCGVARSAVADTVQTSRWVELRSLSPAGRNAIYSGLEIMVRLARRPASARLGSEKMDRWPFRGAMYHHPARTCPIS